MPERTEIHTYTPPKFVKAHWPVKPFDLSDAELSTVRTKCAGIEISDHHLLRIAQAISEVLDNRGY